MKIGERIKALRIESGLTQEAVAESVGVTRQTLSGWENDKSLPDARGIVSLSELYGVTIDAILREDEQIQREMKVQQTVASRRQCFYKTGQIGMFVLAFWVIIAIFWLGGSSVRTLYSILVPYALLPTLTLVFGASLGADELWRWEKWVFLLFGGAANMLWYAMTYGLANVLAHEKSFVQWLEYACELKQFCIGVTLATVGLIIGLVLKSVKRKTIKHLVISESQEK